MEGSVLKSGTPAHPSGWSDEAPSLCGALIGKILLGGQNPVFMGEPKSRGLDSP